MFKSYEFTYAGMPASMFGMYIADMSSNKHSANSFGNKANLVETRLANRVAPIHYGVRYNDSPLSFTLIFGADHKLDRYEMQAVSKWLTGYQEYQWLSIDQPDMEHIQFRCLVQELTPIHLSWVPMAFEAKIICDCHMDIVIHLRRPIKSAGEQRCGFTTTVPAWKSCAQKCWSLLLPAVPVLQ